MKVGDLVKLKSGGPKMTVTSPSEREQVVCTWFAIGQQVRPETYVFPIAALEPAEAAERGR